MLAPRDSEMFTTLRVVLEAATDAVTDVESEFQRDVWRLRVLYPATRYQSRVISFVEISQRWLREFPVREVIFFRELHLRACLGSFPHVWRLQGHRMKRGIHPNILDFHRNFFPVSTTTHYVSNGLFHFVCNETGRLRV